MATPVARPEPPLIVIVGPTASGKTMAAIELAERLGGEVICADSRTVYRGMDIGTAKPSTDEQARVPHWGLNLVEPGERFTVANFKQYALAKIADIRARAKVPILVGGTGLYVDAVVFDYQFGAEADPTRRAELMNWTLEQLHVYCEENNIPLPENKANKRYVIRAIEQKSINIQRRTQPIDNTIIVGIATEKTALRTRIELRTEQLFEDGVVEEAKRLGKKYGWESEAMTGNIYPLLKRYLDDELSLDKVKQQIVTLDWRLAKRQLTWLRRNPYIEWLPRTEVVAYIVQWLASEYNSWYDEGRILPEGDL